MKVVPPPITVGELNAAAVVNVWVLEKAEKEFSPAGSMAAAFQQ